MLQHWVLLRSLNVDYIIILTNFYHRSFMLLIICEFVILKKVESDAHNFKNIDISACLFRT